MSVIVVNYNYGRFVEECLGSILNQTYPNIECIVIDNGSVDDSVERLDRIVARGDFSGDGRSIILLKSDVNLYQTPASVKAFRESKGRFIIFFDADDYMLPGCVEAHIQAMLSLRIPVGATCVDYFMSYGDELIASTSTLGFNQLVTSGAGQQTAFCRAVDQPHTGLGAGLNLHPSELHLVDMKSTGWPWSGTCGLCIRREVVELMLSRVPALREQLDSYLVRSINALTGTVLIDRPLVVYRYHSTNAFSTGPYLANFLNFDRDLHSDAPRIVALEIIETFLAKADLLQKTLAVSNVFVEAVDTLARTAHLRPSKQRFSSFTLEFLVTNKHVLTNAFGNLTYKQWVKRYRRSWRDWFFTKLERSKIAKTSEESVPDTISAIPAQTNSSP